MKKKTAAFACNVTRTDLGLTELQPQGHENKTQAPELPWPACHVAKVPINTMHSTNPDQDRQPTGQFAIHACKNMAHIHRPDGTYAGRLSRSRLDILYQAFLSTATLNEVNVAAEFAEAVCALLIRYKDGFKETESNVTNPKLSKQRATPDRYMKALQEGRSLKIERFASPLNHSEHLEAYFSRYEEDASFGANVDAFSCRWAGPSQCNPEYESDAMDLAVRWALASATETKDPSLTAFVLPYWDMDAYRQYRNNPLVHLLLRVPKKQFRFKKPDFRRADGDDYASHPGWDVNIFIVSNEAGRNM